MIRQRPEPAAMWKQVDWVIMHADTKGQRDESLRNYGEPMERARLKVLRRLDEHCRRFIALSPFLCLGTCSEDGADVSLGATGQALCTSWMMERWRFLTGPETTASIRLPTSSRIRESGCFFSFQVSMKAFVSTERPA